MDSFPFLSDGDDNDDEGSSLFGLGFRAKVVGVSIMILLHESLVVVVVFKTEEEGLVCVVAALLRLRVKPAFCLLWIPIPF